LKQRITVEQLNELSEEQKNRLREWWKPKIANEFVHYVDVPGHIGADEHVIDEFDKLLNGGRDQDKDILPLLSIGQMIEFLESKKPTLHIDKHLKQGMMKKDRYDVFQQGAGTSRGATLCDALWDAVKKAINPQ
jgi:hypothetical protein